MPRYFRGSILTALLLILGCKGTPPEAASADTRQALPLPVAAQDAVRAEMKVMLTSLNQILTALPRRDTAAMRTAAAASGLATAADPTLERLLPEQFLTWGMDTHRAFDTLATAVAAGVPADSIVVQLGAITGRCVTCHATYRLAAAP